MIDDKAIKTHITLGSNQLLQAKRYIGEYTYENGSYLIMTGSAEEFTH